MDLITDSDEIFSLKVYTAAFMIAMQEFTGQSEGAETECLLEQCSDQIARGHTLSI
ncbi:hypothetical protein BH10CYA1_BH10CYA1_58570 [soil metagenome]